MAAPVAPHASDLASRSEILKVAAASLIGTSIEWYDFFLYGTAAALVFNKLFFRTFAPLTGTMGAFATYAVGLAARPVGGIVFGHYGDKLGRKTMLYLTLLIMGVATTAIGLLPTYATIGIWAPILLVAMRLLQGLGIGGEWGGAVLMAIEHAPAHRRGFYGSWPQMGVAIGLLLSTLVFRHFSGYPEATFLAWGWRVPFLLRVILVGSRVSSRSRSDPRRCTRRERASSRSSSPPGCATAERRSPRSSGRCSRAAYRRSSRPRCWPAPAGSRGPCRSTWWRSCSSRS